MLGYKGKTLIKKDDKKAGKNRSAIDGFYHDEEGQEYFIKKPADKKELFTELFAGLILKELISRNLIEPQYISSLIHAELIQIGNEYGLIQPKVSFTELYKIIGTGYSDNSDRSPTKEMRSGPYSYKALTEQRPHCGLPIALMFSLLFGDHSVHSGNVVVLNPISETEPSMKQFARIDWGASFRDFAHPDNNRDDLLDFYQYQGWFNLKRFTQGYFANYKNIRGLFPAMAQKAQDLRNAMDKNRVSMEEIVASAFSQVPAELLDAETKAQLANYMSIPSFATAKFGTGTESDCQRVSEIFSSLLNERLAKISTITEKALLPDDAVYEESYVNNVMHQSIIAREPAIPFTINSFIDLAEQLKLLQNTIDSNSNLDFSQTNLANLARQFNRYVKRLGFEAENANLWNHSCETNIFANYLSDEQSAVLGNAPLREYRESVVLERLYTLDPETLRTLRFAPYESAVRAYLRQEENKNSHWSKIEEMLTLGYSLISDLSQLKKMQSSSDKDINDPALIADILSNLKSKIPLFLKYQKDLNELFEQSPFRIDSNIAFESRSFYFIRDENLDKMHSHQLITICLEELYSSDPSPLVARIIKNDRLWERVERGYSQEIFSHRADNPQRKFAQLKQWHNALKKFYLHKKQFDEASLEEKDREFSLLHASFQELPSFLKNDTLIQEELLGSETLLASWQKERAYVQKVATHQQDTHFNAALASFNALKKAFEDLPEEVKPLYQEEFELMQKKINDWQADQTYLAHQQVYLAGNSEEKLRAYVTLQENFSKLPNELKANYQPTMDEYSRENAYLQQRENYQKYTIVGIRTINFDILQERYKQLSRTQKEAYCEDLSNLWRKTLCYKQLVENEIVKETDDTDTTLIDATLDHLNTGRTDAELLINTVVADKKLWNAVASNPNKVFTEELVQDLLTIHKFYKERADLNFGVEYNNSLDRFYTKALEIRLSDKPIRTQAQEITELAHQEFTPRHKTERKIVDGLMLASVLFGGLGAFIMLGRYCAYKKPFFSQATTAREEDLRLLVKSDLSDEDTGLFNIGSAVASAA